MPGKDSRQKTNEEFVNALQAKAGPSAKMFAVVLVFFFVMIGIGKILNDRRQISASPSWERELESKIRKHASGLAFINTEGYGATMRVGFTNNVPQPILQSTAIDVAKAALDFWGGRVATVKVEVDGRLRYILEYHATECIISETRLD